MMLICVEIHPCYFALKWKLLIWNPYFVGFDHLNMLFLGLNPSVLISRHMLSTEKVKWRTFWEKLGSQSLKTDDLMI